MAHLFLRRAYVMETSVAYQILCQWSKDMGRSCLQCNKIGAYAYDLSIIIPAYNAYSYIEACINSILNQTTKYTFHVFVVNDGSTDQTAELLHQYAEDKHITIYEEENCGAAAARNRALKHLNSTYVMFVDADDLLEPNAIDKLLNAAYAENADAVEGGYFILKDGRKQIGSQMPDKTFDHALGVLSGFTCMKVFRSSLFEDVSFPVGYWFEDTVISMILFPKVERAVTIGDMVYSYRANPKGMTSAAKGSRKALDSFWIMIQLMKDHAALNLPENNEYHLQLLRQIHITYLRTRNAPEQVKKSIFVLSAVIINSIFNENVLTDNWKMQMLETAVKQRKYGLYRLLCEMNESLN